MEKMLSKGSLNVCTSLQGGCLSPGTTADLVHVDKWGKLSNEFLKDSLLKVKIFCGKLETTNHNNVNNNKPGGIFVVSENIYVILLKEKNQSPMCFQNSLRTSDKEGNTKDMK